MPKSTHSGKEAVRQDDERLSEWLRNEELADHVGKIVRDNDADLIGLAWQTELYRSDALQSSYEIEQVTANIELEFMRVLHGQDLDVAIVALDVFRHGMLKLMMQTLLLTAGLAKIDGADKNKPGVESKEPSK